MGRGKSGSTAVKSDKTNKPAKKIEKKPEESKPVSDKEQLLSLLEQGQLRPMDEIRKQFKGKDFEKTVWDAVNDEKVVIHKYHNSFTLSGKDKELTQGSIRDEEGNHYISISLR